MIAWRRITQFISNLNHSCFKFKAA
jgi:hypothetical protein